MIIRIYNYLRPPLARNPRKYWLSAVSVGNFSVAFGGILRNLGAVPGNGWVHFRPLSLLGVIFRNSLPLCSLCCYTIATLPQGVIFRNSPPSVHVAMP